jgi:hypothetical protein
MKTNASQLRANIFKLLDMVIETGIPLDVERKGKLLRIVPVESGSKLKRIVKRKGVVRGDPDDLVHVDWSGEWKP